ncbi:MAG: SDR family oxidoreductase [Myxococcota bacterium]
MSVPPGAPRALPARVLVTGASGGIGRAIARTLAAEGVRVLASGRDEAALRVTQEGFEERMGRLVADLGRPEAASEVVRAADAALGGLEGLVCAAGIARHAPIGALTAPDLEAMYRVNAAGPALLVQAAAELLRAARGAVVLVSSTLAQRPAPGTLGYAMSKAALEAATRVLAAELAPDVRVNAVAPGVVDTPMVRQPRLAPGEPEPVGAARQARIEAQLATLRALHPLGLGTPEDVADAVRYLLGARWLTGTVLTADGGLTAS